MITLREVRRGLRLQTVPRWSVVPTLRPQNVAAHSHGVGLIAMWLMEYHQWTTNHTFVIDVLRYALTHDSEEAVTGDPPSTGKQEPNFKDMSQIEIVVKCADYLEALHFAYQEKVMGNGFYMDAVLEHTSGRFKECWRYFEKNHHTENLEWYDAVEAIRRGATEAPYAHPALED